MANDDKVMVVVARDDSNPRWDKRGAKSRLLNHNYKRGSWRRQGRIRPKKEERKNRKKQIKKRWSSFHRFTIILILLAVGFY